MEADALVKEYTGAKVMAMDQDVAALKAMRPGGKEHPIDRVLKDGDKVTLGGVTLTANLTAGHTAGCTSWTFQAEDAGKKYDALIVCSVGVNANYVLVGDKRNYPSIVEDYRKSFARVRAMKVDVFLGAHPNYYGLEAKYAKLDQGRARPGQPNAFADADGYKAYVADREQAFLKELQRQREAAK